MIKVPVPLDAARSCRTCIPDVWKEARVIRERINVSQDVGYLHSDAADACARGSYVYHAGIVTCNTTRESHRLVPAPLSKRECSATNAAPRIDDR